MVLEMAEFIWGRESLLLQLYRTLSLNKNFSNFSNSIFSTKTPLTVYITVYIASFTSGCTQIVLYIELIKISSWGERLLLSAWLLVPDQSHRTLDESLIGTLLYLLPLGRANIPQLKKQKNWKKWCTRNQAFQTELTSDQTEPRPWSRL